MKTFFILLSTSSILLLNACSKKNIAADENGVLLRIENQCNTKIDSAIIISPGGSKAYHNLNNGEKSGYKPFSFIYRYAYIKIYSGGHSMVIQPTDYVGETKITTGRYTYRVYYVSIFNNNILTVENIKD